MKKTEKQNMKLIGLASTVGAAAVAVSLFAAYSAATKNLIPAGSGSEYVYSYPGGESLPVQNSVPNVPLTPKSSSKSTSSSAPTASDAAQEVNKPVNTIEVGNIMPVNGEVSHAFSNGELVKSETLGVWKTHDGCDILCEPGTDVRSMSEGIVKIIDNSTIWGVCVTIEQSNGLEATYCGLAKELNVKTGSMVKQGEIIGKTGDTNEAEMLQKPHLHVGVKRNGQWIDPMSVIKT